MIPGHAVIDQEYHVVELFRYSEEAIDWCKEKFGPLGRRWFFQSTLGMHKIYFIDKRDHMMFLLRWS